MNTQHYKDLLLEEKGKLALALTDVGRINPDNALDWQPKRTDMDREHSDVIDTADNVEEFNENNAIVNELEVRINDIDTALLRIESGSFGTCRVCTNAIEEDRLEANPAATTCKAHMG